jgi:hypothetical protein
MVQGALSDTEDDIKMFLDTYCLICTSGKLGKQNKHYYKHFNIWRVLMQIVWSFVVASHNHKYVLYDLLAFASAAWVQISKLLYNELLMRKSKITERIRHACVYTEFKM